MSGKAFLLVSAGIVIALCLTGCFVFSEKRWEYRIVAAPSASNSVQIAYDSPEARKLVDDDRPLEDMLKMPGFTVPVKSYCSIIQRSSSKCGPFAEATAVYVLINVTSGPSRGKQGCWACETHIHQLFP